MIDLVGGDHASAGTIHGEENRFNVRVVFCLLDVFDDGLGRGEGAIAKEIIAARRNDAFDVDDGDGWANARIGIKVEGRGTRSEGKDLQRDRGGDDQPITGEDRQREANDDGNYHSPERTRVRT